MHEVISYRGSFARSPAGSARHCSSSFLTIIAREMFMGVSGFVVVVPGGEASS